MQRSTILNPRFVVLVGFIVAAVAMRLIPHPPNFTPIAAMALFGGAYFASRHLAFIIPLAAMLLSDLILGFAGIQQTLFIYGSFALIVCLGLWLQNHRSPFAITAAAVTGSVTFFIITNFAVWSQGLLYPLTFDGLLTSYIMAIPFYANTLAGDLFYTLLLFGGFALAQHYFPRLRQHSTPTTYAHS